MDLQAQWILAGPLAYLDPGSGALLVQILVAGLAGLVLFVKMQGRRVLGFFRLGRKDREPHGPERG